MANIKCADNEQRFHYARDVADRVKYMRRLSRCPGIYPYHFRWIAEVVADNGYDIRVRKTAARILYPHTVHFGSGGYSRMGHDRVDAYVAVLENREDDPEMRAFVVHLMSDMVQRGDGDLFLHLLNEAIEGEDHPDVLTAYAKTLAPILRGNDGLRHDAEKVLALGIQKHLVSLRHAAEDEDMIPPPPLTRGHVRKLAKAGLDKNFWLERMRHDTYSTQIVASYFLAPFANRDDEIRKTLLHHLRSEDTVPWVRDAIAGALQSQVDQLKRPNPALRDALAQYAQMSDEGDTDDNTQLPEAACVSQA